MWSTKDGVDSYIGGHDDTMSWCKKFASPVESPVAAGDASANIDQFDANLKGLEKGPMTSDELKWMREFGAVVHG